jgi:hypothetical protein
MRSDLRIFWLTAIAVTGVMAVFGSTDGFAVSGVAEIEVFKSGSEGYNTFLIPTDLLRPFGIFRSG